MMNPITTATNNLFEVPTAMPFHYHVNKCDEDYDLVTTVTFNGDNGGDRHRIEIIGEVPKSALPKSMQEFFKFAANNDGIEVMDETFFSLPNGLKGNGFTVEVDVRDFPTKWVKGTSDLSRLIDVFKYYEEQ